MSDDMPVACVYTSIYACDDLGRLLIQEKTSTTDNELMKGLVNLTIDTL